MKSIFRSVAGLLIAASALSAGAYAQSNVLYFPYIINDSQTSTEPILTNVTALLGSLAQFAPLLLRERLRGRRSCLRGGLGDGTRAREHNEGESHHS